MNLREIIEKKIKEKGAVRVSEFVELALYHPQLGYYNRKPPVIGKEGDFYTSSDLHPIFGKTIGRYIESKGFDTIIEIGAGKGWLAHDILSEFHGNYWIVERSPYLREIEKEVLGEFPNVKWFESLDDIKPFRGIVLANELFDAFPFDLFKKVDEKWFEILLGPVLKEIHEIPAEEDLKILEKYEGVQFVIIPRGWDELIERIARVHKGEFIVIDYGYARDDFVRRFPYGSIQTYRKHQLGGHFTETPGEQDITFFIDFSLLKETFEKYGYRNIRLNTQADFLIEIGIMDILAKYEKISDSRERVKARLAVKSLIMDFGTTFKVLTGKI